MDITEFLTARYDEDEAAELARLDRLRTLRRALKEAAARIGADAPAPGSTKSRVLADITAKRAIVAEYRELCAHRLMYEESAEGWGARTKLKWICQLLATQYAEHPDLKPEWRIDG